MGEFNYQTLFRDTRTTKNTHRAVSRVYIGERGKPLTATDSNGWYSAGRPTSIPKLDENINKQAIMGDLPGGLLVNIPQDVIKDMTFVFDHFRLETWNLSKASDAAMQFRYAGNGQTTIASSPTLESAVLTSADDINVNDVCIVDCRHATAGGYLDMAIITSVNKVSKLVTFEPIGQVPPVGATFKKLAGKETGTGVSDTGIFIPGAIREEFPKVQLLIQYHMPSMKSIISIHIPEFEVNATGALDFSNLIGTVGFGGNPCIQDPKDYVLRNGTTEKRAWYDDTYVIPFESPADA